MIYINMSRYSIYKIKFCHSLQKTWYINSSWYSLLKIVSISLTQTRTQVATQYTDKHQLWPLTDGFH